jgi:hypothetical protein
MEWDCAIYASDKPINWMELEHTAPARTYSSETRTKSPTSSGQFKGLRFSLAGGSILLLFALLGVDGAAAAVPNGDIDVAMIFCLSHF